MRCCRAHDGLAKGRGRARLRLLGSLLIGIDVLLFGTGAGTAMALTLTSPAFKQGGKIPSSYTCEGDDVSPPLVFEGVPEGTKSLALVIDDPDAPDPKAPKRVWVHWVVFNLPPETKELAENASAAGLPAGAVQGVNDFQQEDLWRSLPADRAASLFPQALCARREAARQGPQQGRARGGDAGPRAGQG